jgi:hypothetical protein
MFLVSLLGQYQAAILVRLNESVQFRFECDCKNLALIASSANFVSGVGEKMIEVDSDQNQKQGRQGKLSDNDTIHIGFRFLVFIVSISMNSFWFTQRALQRARFFCDPLQEHC